LDRKKNIPQIRFQNYEDEWVYSTIGRHISLLNGRAYKQEELLDEGKYRVLRVGNFNTNSKWYYSNLELEDNKYVNKGDLLYLWATNFGPEIWTEEKAIYHYHIWKLEFDKTDINQDYLYIWLESDKNKIQQNTNGSTMVHITKNMMEERRISLPSQDEQSAIGSLFRTLDDLLASYKDNLANYQSLKVTMLSKMFPKAGQTVPEIRLDGFDGEWELIKLGEFCDLITKGTTAKSQSEQGKVNFVKVENLKDNEIYPIVKISEEEHLGSLKRSILCEGDILFSIAGTLGRTAIVRNNILPANTNQALAIIRGYKLDVYFLLVVLSGEVVKDYIRKNPTVGAQPNLSLEQVSSLKIQVPSIEEQQAIGSYFSNLDNLIAAHQEKISQLETLKKKLLQDMFI
jgi:restriction endonuclease S subunit